MRAKILRRLLKIKAATLLALLLVFFYLFFSGGGLFIEKEILLSLSFSLSQPQNLLLYTFVHVSPWHITANFLYLFLFAAIVEQRLGSKHVVLLFFFSAILTVILFCLLNPHASLIGASAGAGAVMASAFVLDLKKTAVALAAITLLALLLPYAVDASIKSTEDSLQLKKTQLGVQLQKAIEGDEHQKAAQIQQWEDETEKELSKLRGSKSFAFETKTGPFVHGYAACFGLIYLFLFRRKQLQGGLLRAHCLFKPMKKQRL